MAGAIAKGQLVKNNLTPINHQIGGARNIPHFMRLDQQAKGILAVANFLKQQNQLINHFPAAVDRIQQIGGKQGEIARRDPPHAPSMDKQSQQPRPQDNGKHPLHKLKANAGTHHRPLCRHFGLTKAIQPLLLTILAGKQPNRRHVVKHIHHLPAQIAALHRIGLSHRGNVARRPQA